MTGRSPSEAAPQRPQIADQHAGARMLPEGIGSGPGLLLDVVALIEHAVHPESGRCALGDDLIQDPEQLERIRRSDDRVVVGVVGGVEVDAPSRSARASCIPISSTFVDRGVVPRCPG